MDIRYHILKETFGYTEFRPGQLRLIDAILAGRDVLGVLPTGAGKSLCYQLPALILPGLTLVLSPLISLMDDQVAALRDAGVPACCLHSGMNASEYAQTMAQVLGGRCHLVYTAPERLENEGFRAMLQSLPISLLVVDEAHCISQWGHDFRPSYRRIPELISILPERPVLAAFTATATGRVRSDIASSLRLHDPERVLTSFDRPNLFYDVQNAPEKDRALLRFLREQERFPGIVYCTTRKAAEHTAQLLSENGISAAAYHGGMDSGRRAAAQNAFVRDRVSVLCATNAFGMGINKSNVRFIVHYQMPANLENYYQEAGRAGRDGAGARCLLLYSSQDFALQQFLIEKDPENEELTEAEVVRLRQEKYRRLREMRRYAMAGSCLRAHILRYFGERAGDFCGACCNCRAASEEKDVTVDAQKLLSCVYRAKEQADAETIIRILQGREDDVIRQHGWQALSTFGLMPDSTEAELDALTARLSRLGYLDASGGPLRLRAEAKKVLFHHEPVTMIVRASAPVNVREVRAANHSVDPAMYQALSALRRKLADRRGVPPYTLLTDLALEDICRVRPKTEEQLFAIDGISRRKLQRFGKKILDTVAKSAASG